MSSSVLNKYLKEYQRQIAVAELQVQAIRDLLSNTVGEILGEVTEISSVVDKGSKKADALLERAYFDPESGQVDLMSSVQDNVDDIFAQASKGADRETNIGEDRLRRLSGQFSKHMEAMSTLDGAVAGVLVEVMGGLSRDDVIGQRLKNLTESLFAIRDGITQQTKDADFDADAWIASIKSKIYSNYTSEAEKAVYLEVFGETP